MNPERDVTPAIRAWVREPIALDDEGLWVALAQLPATPQRHAGWTGRWSGRSPVSRRLASRMGGQTAVWITIVALLATVIAMATWFAVGQSPSPRTFPPGSLLFTRGGVLFLAAADGTGAVEVADGDLETQIGAFAFAPDRGAVAVSRDGPTGAELAVLAPDGPTLVSLPFDMSAATAFSWAPDGSRLVVSLSEDDPALSIVGLDGQLLRTLALPDGFTWGWLEDPWGSWSPDGRWIAVFGCVAPCDHKFDPHLLLVEADGSGWVWVTDAIRISGYTASEAWASDSRLAVFDRSRVVVVSTDGSVRRTIDLPGGMLGGTPAWSPDGNRLAVLVGWSHERTPQSGIVVIDADGAVREVTIARVTPSPSGPDDSRTSIGDIGWSADGNDLLFTGQADASPVRSLYAIDPAGGTPRLLVEDVDEGFDVASAR